jgi:hypothetical protein
VKSLLGKRARGKVARWDQLDISNAKHPRLRCSADDLEDREI